jgi:hypothetical protein
MSRTFEDLSKNPCRFEMQNIPATPVEKKSDGTYIKKIKKKVPRLDANGNQMFEIKKVEKKGCGCKGGGATKIVEQKVMLFDEIYEDVPLEDTKHATVPADMVLCRIYGKVKKDFCRRCSTYKAK